MSDSASGMVLVARDGARFRFDPGALCLELLLTGGPGELSVFESLHEPADLVDWAARAPRLRPTPELVISAGQVVAARQLRDALWRLVGAQLRGDPPAAPDLAVVNAAAAAPPLAPVLLPGAAAWADGRASGSRLLSTVARDAIVLLSGPWADRIRECGADNCRLVFVDTSRPGRRRWCSMERCGNRHKVRALRARRQTEE